MRYKVSCMLLIFVMIGALGASAAISEKKIWKLIGKYDVADTVRKATTAEEFWTRLRASNPRYQKTAKSLRGKGDRDIKESLEIVTQNAECYFAEVPTVAGSYDFSETLSNNLGVRALQPTFTVTVTSEPDFSIFGYPNGYLFITGPIYEYLKNNPSEATMLLSAEAAHFVLQHAYAHAKWEKSRRNKKKVGNFFAGMAVAAAAAAVLSPTDYTEDKYFAVETASNIGGAVAFQPVPQKYVFEYTPDQIVEADIIAYRFTKMKYGSGRPYIDALRTYGFYLEADQPLDEHYYTVADRIKVLETLEDIDLPYAVQAKSTNAQ